MYTRATLTGQDGGQKHIVTFGPVSIAPAYQQRGYGAKLIRHSLLQAKALGYEAVVIIPAALPAMWGLSLSCQKIQRMHRKGTGAILPPCWSVSLRLPPGAGRANLGIPRQPVMAFRRTRRSKTRRYLPPMEKARAAQPRRILYP